MMLSMANYKAVDSDLISFLKSNKEETIVRTQKVSENNDSGFSGASVWGIIITIIAVIRLIAILARD
jgi:hypothetical protein